MKFKPSSEELAKFQALSQQIEASQKQINQLRAKQQKYAQKQTELVESLKEKYDLPDSDLSEWVLSQVNWLEFEGEIIIPENENNENQEE